MSTTEEWKITRDLLKVLAKLQIISKRLFKKTLNKVRDSKRRKARSVAKGSNQMTSTQPEWMKYWSKVSPNLTSHLQSNTDARIIRYIVNCIAISNWLTEDWDKKSTKHQELYGKLSIFLVEILDIMRGILAGYEHMTMAPLALMLRTAFEIRVNLKFIIGSDDPAKWADLFDRFQSVEQLLGAKASAALPNPTVDDWKSVAAKCPEWFEPATIKLKQPIHWTATKTDLRQLAAAKHVRLEEEYVSQYKTNSKFIRAPEWRVAMKLIKMNFYFLLIFLVCVESKCLAQDEMTLLNNTKPSAVGDKFVCEKGECKLVTLSVFSLFRDMGIKEGDVIKKWNDKKIGNKGDQKFIYQTINEQKDLTAVVERKGKEMVFHYSNKTSGAKDKK